MEQVGPAGPPLAIRRLYADYHCQLHRHGIGNASRLGSLLAAATALPAVVHRPLHVRVAVCRQVARRATRRRIGVNTIARTSEKSPKVAKKGAAKQGTTKPVLLSGGNPQIAKGDGDAPYRPTSPPCRAGNAISGAASTRSSWALSPTYARRSNGTRHFTESRIRAGSLASIALRSTSKWLSFAARR